MRGKQYCKVGKVKHVTLASAHRACDKLEKEKNVIVTPYKCKKCHSYHIGKPSFNKDPILFWQNNFYNKGRGIL